MAAPNDNTEIVNMFRDVKNCIWNSLTPVKVADRHFSGYLSNLKSSSSLSGSCSFNPPSVSTKLNFTELDDSSVFLESSVFKTMETPEALKRKLINTEVELQASKAKIKEKESLISLMEPANKKMCYSLENKLEGSRKQNEVFSEKIIELEAKLNMAKKQIASSKSQTDETERYKEKELNQREQRILNLQEQCSNLKIEVASVKSEKAEAVRKLNHEIGNLEIKLSIMSDETEQTQAYVKSLKRQVNDMEEKVAKHDFYQNELKQTQENIRILESKIESDKEAALIVASRQNDLRMLSELQSENRLLKEEASRHKENNVALYQEKLWSIQEKLTQAEKKSILVVKLQVENEQLKAKIDQWEELLDNKSSFRSPTSFSRKLSEYQQNEAILTNKLSQVTTQNKVIEKQKNDQIDMIATLNHKLQQVQSNLSLQENLIKRMQRKIIFLTKAKENTQKLLDSYLSESTMAGIGLNVEQMHHLEESNKEYKKELEKTEKELEDVSSRLISLGKGSFSPSSNAELKRLRKENEELSIKISNLIKDNKQLKDKCSQQVQGENTRTEKILHLRMNPLEIANQKHLQLFARLQEDNDELKKRIKVLEEEGFQAADVTLKARHKLESEGADSTLQSLKEQLAAADRKQRFILDNARIKSREFREAVYRLTGFRIDVPSSETYKLSHVYADSREDFLLFKINSEGIQLVETDYLNQLKDRMELYLHQHDSFPAFLASLTMNLFNQQTFALQP